MNQKDRLLNNNEYYKTSDLALAAVLSLYYSIDSIDKQNPRKATFYFKEEAGFQELLETYWNHTLKVDPQTYFNQLKAIKHRLYSER